MTIVEINFLRQKEAELLYLKDLKFKTEKEFQIYYQDNKDKFDLLQSIQNQIQEYEWTIKSPQEKEDIRIEKIKLSQKFQGVNPDDSYRSTYLETVSILYEELRKCASTEKELIYILATLLSDMERKPFAPINIKISFTKRSQEMLKQYSAKLYDNLVFLSESK